MGHSDTVSQPGVYGCIIPCDKRYDRGWAQHSQPIHLKHISTSGSLLVDHHGLGYIRVGVHNLRESQSVRKRVLGRNSTAAESEAEAQIDEHQPTRAPFLEPNA